MLTCRLLTECIGLRDAYTDDTVYTVDKHDNIFTKKTMKPKRIDFILYSDELSSRLTLELRSRRLAMTGTIPGEAFPYSDHDGVEGVFQICKRPEEEELPLFRRERVMTGKDKLAVCLCYEIYMFCTICKFTQFKNFAVQIRNSKPILKLRSTLARS